MKKAGFSLLILSLLLGSVTGQETDFLKVYDQQIPKKANKEFQFIAYYYNQAVSSNYYPTNDFLKGQVIGRLFGSNTTSTSDSLTTGYFEQRLLPFFIYQPRLFNGRAVLRASFEIDWTWGDVAYGTGGNFGSAVSADQVNIQTQNVELELIPAKGWAINLGLQRMYDTPYNPYRTYFDDMTYSGYRLMYFGTDGVGISVRHDRDKLHAKGGFYQLYENSIQENDDVTLGEFNFVASPTLKWDFGGSVYFVNDNSNGEGGPSILGQGLNATLNDYSGVYRFPLAGQNYRAKIAWLGAHFARNKSLMQDKFLLTGFFNYNLGSVRTSATNTNFTKHSDIGGFGANLRASYRYASTPKDAITADFYYTTGDENGLNDRKYSGVLTGNTWGAPGAVFISSGSYILFPHGNVVNRFVAAVGDLSNMGYGLLGGTINLSRDFIPNKLNAKLGLAMAQSQYAPAGGGKNLGVEYNGKIGYQLGTFMSLEVHGAYLDLGDFFDSPRVNGGGTKPINPWTVFIAYKWLMF